MKGKKKEIKRIGFEQDEEEEEFEDDEEEIEDEPIKEKKEVEKPKSSQVELKDILTNHEERLRIVESSLFRIKGTI